MSASPTARQAMNVPQKTKKITISDPIQMPEVYSSTPGGTLYSTTPGGKLISYLVFKILKILLRKCWARSRCLKIKRNFNNIEKVIQNFDETESEESWEFEIFIRIKKFI